MKRYTIEYGDGYGADRVVVGQWSTRAHDYEHAIEKFHDSSEDDGFIPFRVAMTEPPSQRHAWNWKDLP